MWELPGCSFKNFVSPLSFVILDVPLRVLSFPVPQVVPKHPAPRRPLPGSPLLAKELPPAHGQTLLVMVPPSNFKVPGTSGSSHPSRPIK